MLNIKKILAKIAAFFPPTKPKTPAGTSAGDSNIRLLLLHLCNGDVARAEWVMRWLAYPMRHPGAKMETALAVGGAQGSGKSLFFERIIHPMHGRHAGIVSGEIRLTLTSWAQLRYAVIMEFGATATALANLRQLLCSTSIILRPQPGPPVIARNELNMVIMSNDVAALPNLVGTRRLFVINTVARLPASLASAVAFEIENGGLVDFYTYLLKDLDMGDFNESTSIDSIINTSEVRYA